MKTFLIKDILFSLFILSTTVSCQDYGNLEIVTSLPTHMDEVSGIEMISGSPLLWMIDDGGNSPKIYGYDIHAKVLERQLRIEGVKNNDWEDLASDNDGNLYVGDFGNNNNKRKNLAIYKIGNLTSDADVSFTTNFYFEDQIKFPPKKKDRNFDVEAFFFLKDFFYLFTRNRSSNFDGTTKLYKIPAQSGNFKAKLIGQYKTCEDQNDCQITSATINHNNGMIALLSYNKIWIIRNYQDDDFFNGTIEKIKLKHTSQKESITFMDDNSIYIADERNKGIGGNIYLLKL